MPCDGGRRGGWRTQTHRAPSWPSDVAPTWRFAPIVLFEAWRELGHLRAPDEVHVGPDTDRLLELGSAATASEHAQALDLLAQLRPAALALLDGADALVGPVVPFPEPERDPVLESPGR
jgi:Asp-tRNA(Asn)/Glu-tRNA(Gln) amidotransferase A subunit family amidase